uniref:Uncharacterized protein n=1 Tax=Heterorhabditis bacteriophora TaxID=37862 RepID=A0A1I7XS37_HETBA
MSHGLSVETTKGGNRFQRGGERSRMSECTERYGGII